MAEKVCLGVDKWLRAQHVVLGFMCGFVDAWTLLITAWLCFFAYVLIWADSILGDSVIQCMNITKVCEPLTFKCFFSIPFQSQFDFHTTFCTMAKVRSGTDVR